MSEKTTTRWRLTPLDESGLIYLGLDVTNGNQTVLFIQTYNSSVGKIRPDDSFLRDALFSIVVKDSDETETVEMEGREFFYFHWSKEFDRSLAVLIDRLIHMRMANSQSISLKLQLEMPI